MLFLFSFLSEIFCGALCFVLSCVRVTHFHRMVWSKAVSKTSCNLESALLTPGTVSSIGHRVAIRTGHRQTLRKIRPRRDICKLHWIFRNLVAFRVRTLESHLTSLLNHQIVKKTWWIDDISCSLLYNLLNHDKLFYHYQLCVMKNDSKFHSQTTGSSQEHLFVFRRQLYSSCSSQEHVPFNLFSYEVPGKVHCESFCNKRRLRFIRLFKLGKTIAL